MAGLIIWALILSGGLVYAFASSPSGALTLVQFAAFFVAGVPLAIAIHEAGHVLAAAALRRQALKVVLGKGSVWRRYQVAGTSIEVRRDLWAGGLTRHSPSGGRISRTLILLAGPAANAVAAFALFMVSRWLESIGAAPTAVAATGTFALAAAEGLMVAISLVPSRSAGSGPDSDGMQLWRLLTDWRMPADLSEIPWLPLVNAYCQLGWFEKATALALQALDRSPNDTKAAFMAIHCLSRSQGDAAAIGWWLSRTFEPDANTSQLDLALLKANIAWSALKSNRADLAAMIDAASAEALAAAPDRFEMIGTRGAWLVEGGAFDEGVLMLTAAVRASTDPFDRSDLCRFLSRAMDGGGDRSLATAFDQVADRFHAEATDRVSPLQ